MWDLAAARAAGLGYEVRSHWISCVYTIPERRGKVCRTLSGRKFFLAAGRILANMAVSC